jgi:Nuclease-related domain
MMNSSYWLAAAAGVVVLGIGLLGVIWWRKRRSSLGSALRGVAVDRLEDVLLPDGMGGHIHVEHLLLTARGILVVNVKRYEGVVFASDRMDEWTVMGAAGRFAFPNPQGALYDRVAAVRQLIRDVAVTGVVLFPAGADFSKGRPKDVLLAPELADRYKKPERSDIERLTKAYAPHWERVREATQPANTRPPKLR